jgi:CRP-like cAMP-binding protein
MDAVVTLLPQLVGRALLSRRAAAAVVAERLERVRQKLLQFARAHGRVASDGVHLDLPLTHELIAQTTGSARETVTAATAERRREASSSARGAATG